LSRHYIVPHISTGDMFRAAVRSGSEFGKRAQQYMEAGELIPDEVVIGVVQERLEQDDTAKRGFILDGFPRTTHQAEALAGILAPREIDLVIDLEVDTDHVLERLAGRRVCEDCGANYHVLTPPKRNWSCDVCGGDVVQRPDDTELSIRRRLELYARETAPLIKWYRERNKLTVVDGIGTPQEVSVRMIEAIDRHRALAAN
jgi:adenylate kinase